MPGKKQVEHEVERTHGHCADVLMSDYGIPKNMRLEVCEEVAKLWQQNTLIHCLIIASVRGWQPVSATNGLKSFLEQRQTHSPKNHMPMPGPIKQSEGHFDAKGFYYQSDNPYDEW